MVATLGASAGIAGLTLVFLGLVVSNVRLYEPGVPAKVLAKQRRPAKTVLAAFACSLLATVLAAAWLVSLGDAEWLYIAALVAFFAQIAVLCAAVAHVLKGTLWGS